MTQETFEALLFQYWQKDTKAGEYARKIIRQLMGVSMDLLLRKEAGLMHEEAAKESRGTRSSHETPGRGC